MDQAFQVSSSEDAMAISLFRKAADAIVARSELAQNVRSLETETTYLKTQVDRLSTERNNMDETVRYLTAQLTEAKRKVDELEANNNRHVERIGELEHSVEALQTANYNMQRERDDAQFDLLAETDAHAVTKAALADATTKLTAIQSLFPVPVAAPEVAATSTFPAEANRAGANSPSGFVPMEPMPTTAEPWGSSYTSGASSSSPSPETPTPSVSQPCGAPTPQGEGNALPRLSEPDTFADIPF